jgi:hypothetical protein
MRYKSLEILEKDIWPEINAEGESSLVRTCNALRKKQLKDFTTEDLRIMISQEIGLGFLMPLAIERLTDDLLAEGDMFQGDLLKSVLCVNTGFWNDNKQYWQQLYDLIKDRRQEIAKMKFDTSKFDLCLHKQ